MLFGPELLQTPTVTVTKSSDTCYEGGSVTLSAKALTSIKKIDDIGFTYWWTSSAGDTSHVDLYSDTLTYACGSVGDHEITLSVREPTGAVYAVHEFKGTYSVQVTNGLLHLNSATVVRSSDYEPIVAEAFAGDIVTLIIVFSDSSTDNKHTLDIDWGDATDFSVKKITTTATDEREFIVKYTYAKASPIGTPFKILITVTDSATIPSFESISVDMTITLAVSSMLFVVVTFRVCIQNALLEVMMLLYCVCNAIYECDHHSLHKIVIYFSRSNSCDVAYIHACLHDCRNLM
jgi:hypothetical protein